MLITNERFLAELQIPNVPQVKKAKAQQPFSMELCDFGSGCIGRWGEQRDVPALVVMKIVLVSVRSSLCRR